MKRRLLWLIPLGLAVIIAAIILALPAFVASGKHRATIQALASSLTGRQVTIGGTLSLAFTPAPQLVAGNITIAGPEQEIITARSLTLDVALPALLQGRLSARNLTLDSPDIAFPWPLPGGPGAIAPPPWLTALHARITNGTISLGNVTFSGVDADVFTGADGAVAISGNGSLGKFPLAVSVSLGAADAADRAALAVTAKSSGKTKLDARFDGMLDGASRIDGTADLAVSMPGFARISVSTNLQADAAAISARNIAASQAAASLTGSVTLALPQPSLTLNLIGQNLDLAAFAALRGSATTLVPGTLQLTAENSTLGTLAVPHLVADITFGPTGIAARKITAGLPGGSDFMLSGTLDAQNHLAGQASLTTARLPDLVGTPDLPASWQKSRVSAAFNGDARQLAVSSIAGALGPDAFTGGIVLTRAGGGTVAAGQLHFTQLDLTPFAGLLRQAHRLPGLNADGEITVDRASLGPVSVTNLLLDAAVSDQLAVRRLSFNLLGGIAAASFRLGADGSVTAGSALLSVPSAAGFAALLPPGWRPPKALANAPLSLTVLAEGPPTALATSAAGTLGPVSLTAAPVLNIPQQTATGPLTLRHPNAIAALNAFGFGSGLPWPGAGSIALRANLAFSPVQFGLPDFVLSLGDLTANGQLMVTQDHQITAQITADTLALPPLPRPVIIPWDMLATMHGRIDIAANRVWIGGHEILGASSASATLAGTRIDIALPRATLAGGNLSGSLSATLAPNQAPDLAAKFTLTGADAGAFALQVAFPFTFASGKLSAQADLTANGFAQAAWAATLAGTASLNATGAALNGFTLAGLTAALKSPKRFDALRNAATNGTTNADTIDIAGSFDHGNFTIAKASLAGPEGNASATGSVDIPDNDLALEMTLLPSVSPPLSLNVTTLGNWGNPKQIPVLRPGLAWTPAP